MAKKEKEEVKKQTPEETPQEPVEETPKEKTPEEPKQKDANPLGGKSTIPSTTPGCVWQRNMIISASAPRRKRSSPTATARPTP